MYGWRLARKIFLAKKETAAREWRVIAHRVIAPANWSPGSFVLFDESSTHFYFSHGDRPRTPQFYLFTGCGGDVRPPRKGLRYLRVDPPWGVQDDSPVSAAYCLRPRYSRITYFEMVFVTRNSNEFFFIWMDGKYWSYICMSDGRYVIKIP